MYRYKVYRIPVHFIFWIFVLLFYTLLFGYENRDYRGAFNFVVILLPITISTTYFLNYYLIPKLLLSKKYFRFFLFFIYTIIVSITLELNAVIYSLIRISDSGMERMVPASFNIFYLIAANYLVVFLAVAIKLLNHWYSIQNQNLLLEKESMEIELKLKEAELRLLKAQIHPHFLFNTLNNLYGLALSGSDKTPEIVLKISSLLDFMLYGSMKPKVRLIDEINYIKDYIDLEKLRYHKINLEWVEEGIKDEDYIAPMLLQPLVENAFKHGSSRDNRSPWIRMEIRVEKEDELEFLIRNSIPDGSRTREGAGEKKAEGIGLFNIKKRLNILYPGYHSLETCENAGVFTVRLRISLNRLKK